ncbi:MAG: aminoacyl-tRNA hydrolase, partial [bacterium]
LGIGEPVGYWEDFVLSPFKRGELPLVERLIPAAADAVQTLIRQGIVCAMDQFNHLQIAAE